MDFNCKIVNCKGDCCGTFPISPVLFRAFRRKINRSRQITNIFDVPSGEIQIETSDGKCIFLNNSGSCNIYKSRPKICREYGSKKLPCPYITPEGEIRTPEDRKRTQEFINQDVDRKVAKLKKEVGEI